MLNPFDGFDSSSTTSSPDIAKIFGESTEAAKRNILSEATDLGRAAKKLDSQHDKAMQSGSATWQARVRKFALRLRDAAASFLARLGKAMGEFIVKAIELAVFKLVLELCAMVMVSVMAALTAKGGQRMDISTPGVFMNPTSGAAPQNPQQAQRPMHSVFSGPFGGASTVADW